MSRVFERVSTRETGEDWNLTAITPQHMRLIRVIEPLVRFEITSMNSNQNCTTRGSITTLLHPFWNHPNTGLSKLEHFIDAVLSRLEIKIILFFWEGGGWRIRVLETKVAKFATILFVFHFPAIRLVTLNNPWNLIGCFVFSVAPSLAGEKMRFKAKNGAIREWIAPIRANQITGTTSDFRMGVTNKQTRLFITNNVLRFVLNLIII